MTIYHYRSMHTALLEINNSSFHFAGRDELNDPIEGYVHVVWRGDKAAWEGLFRNYACSVYHAILQFLIKEGEEALRHKSLIRDFSPFTSLPLSQEFKALGRSFLEDADVQKLASFYGDHALLVQEYELKFILHYMHTKALVLCIQMLKEKGILPIQEADTMLGIFSSSANPSFPYDAVADDLPNEEARSMIMKNAEITLEDMIEERCASMGWSNPPFLYGFHSEAESANTSQNPEARQQRDWMTITVDYPGVYVEQLKDMIYPKTYVVCFSAENTNAAMWGNYAENHTGVCLIYETDENNGLMAKGPMSGTSPVTAVRYGGDMIERNFFETFGRMTRPQIKEWLSGLDGISKVYDSFSNEEAWRRKYWEAFEAKTYKKIPAWSYEKEYRIALTDMLHDYSDPKSRNLKYDPKRLKGVIFGVKTSEYDKKCILKALREHASEFEGFKFYQAEYDDRSQGISVREKVFWKL